MVQDSIGSLPFIPDISILNSISEDGAVDEESRHDNFQDQLGDDPDIQLADR